MLFFSYHGKEFLVRIKINELEDIPIRCIVYQTAQAIQIDGTYLEDVEGGLEDKPDVPPAYWKFSFNEPIFEDQREQLYMLPRHPLPEILTNERRHLAAASEYRMSVEEIINLVQKYRDWKEKRDNALYAN